MTQNLVTGVAGFFASRTSASDLSMLTDLLRRGLHQRGEQFFIRISSPGNLDALWADRGFQDVIELIAPLGPGLQASVEQF
jgi:hypothetical protein